MNNEKLRTWKEAEMVNLKAISLYPYGETKEYPGKPYELSKWWSR
jgi:hypothetical protein